MKLKIVFIALIALTSLSSLGAQIEMILVPSGEFVQGCTEEQKPDCDGDEFPIHAVKLDTFLLGKYEVTQDEWQAIMGDNPSMNTSCGSNCPLENADWFSMLIFCNELTLLQAEFGVDDLYYFKDENLEIPWSLSDYGGSGDTPSGEVYISTENKGFRLPSEAEWEFAARGGSGSNSFKYSGSDNLDEVGWYDDNSDDSIQPVGLKKENGLGLYDMSGNVWERVFDIYGDYEKYHVCNPMGPIEGSDRVNRGGAYKYSADNSMISSRFFNKPSRGSSNLGFRIARSH